MPLYRNGTITVAQGSRSVVGVGTEFGLKSSPGDILVHVGTQGVHYYEVLSIESDTELTLDIEAYESASGVDFVIIRSVSTANNLYLMRKIDEFLKNRQVSLVEFRDWINGTVDGGPEGDGLYPLTDRFGEVSMVPSPALMLEQFHDNLSMTEELLLEVAQARTVVENLQTLAGSVSDDLANMQVEIQDVRDDAASAANSASAAASSATAAQTARTGVETARDAAASSASAAAGSASTANTHRQSAESAKNAAASSQSAAASSATAAQTARIGAESAKTAAENARNAASSSATAAEGSKTAAASSASAAAGSATAAAGSATAAQTARTGAETARNAASSSATAAAGSATAASGSATAAASSATASGNSANLAKDWAEKMDGPVEGDGRSAKYWADQSAQSAKGTASNIEVVEVEGLDATNVQEAVEELQQKKLESVVVAGSGNNTPWCKVATIRGHHASRGTLIIAGSAGFTASQNESSTTVLSLTIGNGHLDDNLLVNALRVGGTSQPFSEIRTVKLTSSSHFELWVKMLKYSNLVVSATHNFIELEFHNGFLTETEPEDSFDKTEHLARALTHKDFTSGIFDATDHKILRVRDLGLGKVYQSDIITSTPLQNLPTGGNYHLSGNHPQIPIKADGSLAKFGVTDRPSYIYTAYGQKRVFFTTEQSFDNWTELTLNDAEGVRNKLGLGSIATKSEGDYFAKATGNLGYTDLNTLGHRTNAQGIYAQQTTANATPELNYPLREAGTLLVLPTAYGCQQLYITYNSSRIFSRGLTSAWTGSGPWSPWVEPAHWNNVRGKPAIGTAAGYNITTSRTDTEIGKVLKVGDFGLGNVAVDVTSQGDWDLITESGVYMASGLENSPPWGGWSIVQSYKHNAIYSQQIAYRFTSSAIPRMAIRSRVNGVWGEWRENLTTAHFLPEDKADLEDVQGWGLGSTQVKTLTSFIGEEPTGFYQARGAMVASPTPFCPPESGNNILSVYKTRLTGTDHYVVVENAGSEGDQQIWFGNKHTDTVLWAKAVTPKDLGTAAEADLTDGSTDSRVGRVLKAGDFGLGSKFSYATNRVPPLTDFDADDIPTGFYRYAPNLTENIPSNIYNYGAVLNIHQSWRPNASIQLLFSDSWVFPQLKVRTSTERPWFDIYHSGNFSPDNKVNVDNAIFTTSSPRLRKDGANYFQGQAEDASPRWYVGVGSSTNDNLMLHSYTFGTNLTLSEDRVRTNKDFYVRDDLVYHSGNFNPGTAATLNVGTGAGTVAAGNDSRITGAAQKSANLNDLTNAATARTNLGLGTAATHDVTTSLTDTSTERRILRFGDFGVGDAVPLTPGTDLNDLLQPAEYRWATNNSPENTPYGVTGFCYLKVTSWGDGAQQMCIPSDGNRIFFRVRQNSASAWQPWVQLYHSGNFNPGTAATRNVGTTSGTVAAGDDTRIRHAVQSATPGATIIVSTSAPTGGNDGDIWLRYE